MSFTAAADPRSPWPFGDPVATALLGLLEVELRGRGLRWRVSAPEQLEVVRDGAGRPGRTVDVAALRGRMQRSAKADWPDLVEQAVACWLAETESAPDGPGSPNAPWAAPLRSLLLPAQLAAATAGALTRPALPGLTEVVLCESGPHGGGRLLAAQQAGSWAAAAADVFVAARANVRRQGLLTPGRAIVDGVHLTLLGGAGPYCPTHVFWLQEYLDRDGFTDPENGALVVLPHRHLLAYHAIASTEAVTAVGALLRLASREFETAPGPLTDQLYWWRPTGLSALPLESVGSELRILPAPEFEDLLARLPAV